MNDGDFANKVQEHFPEGLTGIFSIGSSRSSYILEQSHSSSNPGAIDNLADYYRYSVDKIQTLIKMYMDLGGRYFILLGIIFPKIEQPTRSKEYQNKIFSGYQVFLNQKMHDFFIENEIDPYFLNLDSWLHPHLPSEVHALAYDYMQFKKDIPHHPTHKKVIFDVDIQPLYAIWKNMSNLDRKEYDGLITQMDRMDTSELGIGKSSELLFEHMVEKSCGIKIPAPHLYLASSTRGTFKWVTSLPSLYSPTHHIKLYFTPYPIFLLKQPTLKRIIDELMCPKTHTSNTIDYRGMYSTDQLQSEHERIKKLADDPESTLGLSRNFGKN